MSRASRLRFAPTVAPAIWSGAPTGVAHHLKAGAKAGLDGERLLAALTSADRVTAEAAVAMGDHVRGKLGPSVTAAALLSRLEDALTSFGAALGATDAKNIERQLRTAVEVGASRSQLQQAIETVRKVQENAVQIHQREAERLLDALVTPPPAPENGCAADDDNSRRMFDGACCRRAARAETRERPTAPEAVALSKND